MKILRFLSVFAIFGILFSCSAPKASRTYSTKEVLDKIYTGNWSDRNTHQNTWYAAQFTESGNQFYLAESTGNSEQNAINNLPSQTKYPAKLDPGTGYIVVDTNKFPGGTYTGSQYRIQSETQLDRYSINLNDNTDIIYVFEGTMKLKTN